MKSIVNSTYQTSDLEANEIEIQAGQYWKLKNDFNYIKGTLLLIGSLNITDSWKVDKCILELVHILKTFNFKKNKLVVYGY